MVLSDGRTLTAVEKAKVKREAFTAAQEVEAAVSSALDGLVAAKAAGVVEKCRRAVSGLQVDATELETRVLAKVLQGTVTDEGVVEKSFSRSKRCYDGF